MPPRLIAEAGSSPRELRLVASINKALAQVAAADAPLPVYWVATAADLPPAVRYPRHVAGVDGVGLVTSNGADWLRADTGAPV